VRTGWRTAALGILLVTTTTVRSSDHGQAEPIGPEPGTGSPFGEAFFTATAFSTDAERGLQLGTINRHQKNKHGRMSVKGKAIEVLLPTTFDAAKRYRVVYLLSACGRLDGEALQVIQDLDLHNTLDCICVLPQMGGWYGEHPTDIDRRSQSYLRDVVVPLIEKRYQTVPGKEGRLLLGFSKSGWGAISILLNQHEHFGYAASWDAPLMFEDDQYQRWGQRDLGTLENWRHYHPRDSAERVADHFQDRTRIVHFAGRAWGKHGPPYHEHLEILGIKHVWSDAHTPKHEWHADWVGPAMQALVALATRERTAHEPISRQLGPGDHADERRDRGDDLDQGNGWLQPARSRALFAQ